jgi:hypothetical protein
MSRRDDGDKQRVSRTANRTANRAANSKVNRFANRIANNRQCISDHARVTQQDGHIAGILAQAVQRQFKDSTEAVHASP